MEDIENNIEDFDTENHNFAKIIFEVEEGKIPDMDSNKDIYILHILQLGIQHTRLNIELNKTFTPKKI